MVLVAIVLAILAPIIARLMYLAVSRRREYLADASAVEFSRYPEGLARALEKMDPELRVPLKQGGHLRRDPREKERKKSGQPGARKKFQFSKR